MPLWLRWTLAVAAFVALGVGLFAATRPVGAPQPGPAAVDIAADRQGRMAVAQDQAPRTATLPSGSDVRRALERAIEADVRRRVRSGDLPAPEQGARCTAAGRQPGRRRAFRCTALAGALGFPFLAVADVRARRLTWCKRVLGPSGDPALDVPPSRRCRL